MSKDQQIHLILDVSEDLVDEEIKRFKKVYEKAEDSLDIFNRSVAGLDQSQRLIWFRGFMTGKAYMQNKQMHQLVDMMSGMKLGR